MYRNIIKPQIPSCLTCRNRGASSKCDQTRPYCNACKGRGLECTGEGYHTVGPLKVTIRPNGNNCLTCRDRKRKCDKARPTCKRCEDDGKVCRGYKNSTPSYKTNADTVVKAPYSKGRIEPESELDETESEVDENEWDDEDE